MIQHPENADFFIISISNLGPEAIEYIAFEIESDYPIYDYSFSGEINFKTPMDYGISLENRLIVTTENISINAHGFAKIFSNPSAKITVKNPESTASFSVLKTV